MEGRSIQALLALSDAWGEDIDAALQRIAAAAVPHLADLCIVDVLEANQTVRRAAIAAAHDDVRAAAQDLVARFAPTIDSPQPAGRVLRSGEPELLPVVDEAVLLTHTRGPEHVAIMRRIGLRSHLQVPVLGPDGTVLGGIGFGHTRSGRAFGEEDVVIASRFASRAALAIIDARMRSQLRAREEQARRLEERLRLALDGGRVGTWDLDPAGGSISWDERCREMFGVPPSDDPDYGALLASIIHPDDAGLVDDAVKRAFATDGQYRAVYRVRRPSDGETAWISAAGQAQFAGEGAARRVVRFVGTCVDVTELRRAEAKAAQEASINHTLSTLGRSFASELDRNKLAQLVTDEATRVVAAQFGAFFFNVDAEADAAAGGAGDDKYMLYTLSGAPREAFAGFGMPRATAVFGPTFRGEGIIRLDDVRTDPRYGKNAPHQGMPKGHLPVVSYLAAPVVGRSGEVYGGLFFGHPEPNRFTPMHERTIEGLASLAAVAFENARLYERLIQEQGRARAALEVARLAERRKDEFLAMLSHELRNPLAPILTALSLMKMGHAPERARDVIERQVHHLRGLVEDLLDVSRITSGKLELKRDAVGVAEVVADAVEMAAPLIEQRAHRLVVKVEAGLVVDGDRLRLAQVVANLLTNAARYTPAGGNVVVSARGVGNDVEIEVADDGQGIAPDLLARLWEPFVQGERPSDQAGGGLGLGLALVRGLVELHGGSASAHSEGVGAGSRFVVRLARGGAGVAAAPLPASGASPRRERALRVLVVDDNRDHADLLRDLLDLAGHEVVAAYDGAQALQQLDVFTPEAAVLDLGLPVMDGYELARRVRERCPGIRLIALSGYGQPDDKRRAREAGFDLHFVKPVDPPVLLRALVDT